MTAFNATYFNLTLTNISEGIHNVSFSCNDTVNNYNTTLLIEFSINRITISSEPASSSSGGGGKRLNITYEIKEDEIKEEVSKILYLDDKIIFQIQSAKHSIKILKIEKDYAEIEISSNPINDTLLINQSKKYNLNDDLFYDIFVRLEGIKNNKANLTIKEIHEQIELPKEQIDENKAEIPREVKGEKELEKEAKRKYYILIYLIFALVILFIVIISVKKKRKK